MFARALALSFAILLLAPCVAAASEAGVNTYIDTDGTPIHSIVTPEISTDGVEFHIEVVLEGAARENGTSVEWTIQQCLNSGVCNPPEKRQMDDDGGVWKDTLIPVDSHSYVNYDIVLTYPDAEDSEKFPSQGFSKGGKVWSDCWVSGEDSGGDNCDGDGADDGLLPASGLVAGIGATMLAAMMARRED